MQNIINFGMILSIIVIVALLADIILAPALMVLYYKKEKVKCSQHQKKSRL